MTKISLIALAITIVIPNQALSAGTCTMVGSTTQTGGCANAAGGSISVDSTTGCKTFFYTCHAVGNGTGTKVQHCGSCDSGYETSIVSKSDTFCTSISQTICVKSTSGSGSSGSSTCDMATCSANNNTWSAHIVGVQKQEIKVCQNNSCNIMQTNYRCAQGFYGSPNVSTLCEPCPSLEGSTTRGLSAVGSTKVTDCYWPSGGGGNDGTGKFTFTGNCYYAE